MGYKIDPNYPHLGGNICGGDKRTFYPPLWKWLIDTLNVKTALDVGCGTGEALREIGKHCTVMGIDGLPDNVFACNGLALAWDLTGVNKLHMRPVDLVWCCELVEHVEEQYVDNVIAALSPGDWIAMTAAKPGQGGWHHVNEQPAEYWKEKLSQEYNFRPDLTQESMKYGHSYWKDSGMIFEKKIKKSKEIT